MHLFELPELGPRIPRPGLRVPAWTLGCFRRRSITFCNGSEDTDTLVLWLQSHGLTADFRWPRAAEPVPAARLVAELGPRELCALARVEAGLAQTSYDGSLMHWSGWASFQTHARWPEPGQLARVGNCLVELAPSGAYVEDWRLLPSEPGPLIGLSLLDERDLNTGEVRHRGGGLIVCGQHAAFVRGRPVPLPEGGRLEAFVHDHLQDRAALARAFAFDAAYGMCAPGRHGISVTLATLPWRLGEPLLELEGFSRDASSGLIVQRVEEAGFLVERRFEVDTLEREFSPSLATQASPEALGWLQREGDALLATAR